MRIRLANFSLLALGASMATALVLTACGGDGSGASTGTLRLALTDVPACGYDHVYVTVVAAKVHQSAAAGDNDPGWQTITLPSLPKRIDLRTLTNGLLEELGQTVLPAGTYTQLRLVLAPNGNQAPYANAVVPTGGSEAELTTPSGQQSGLKLNINLTVNPDQLADFVLDFDACKSVVTAGSAGKYNLKPVIAVFPRIMTGMAVDGYVSNWTAYTAVSLQLNGTVVRSTVPSTDPTKYGYFVLPYLPATGTGFDLVISTPDPTAQGTRTTQVVTAVPVVGTSITHINAAASPIALTPSNARTVSGNVTAGATIPDATVSALQAVAPGKQVEVASARVDSVTGGYSFTLPTAAVQTAAFAAPAPLVWGAYNASAAQYTVRSSVPGTADKTAPADLTSSPATVNFSY